MDDITFDVDNFENFTINISVHSPDPALVDVRWIFQPLSERNNDVLHKLDIDNQKYLGSNLLEPSLTIINTSTNASGYYQAFAENGVGSASTAVLTLRIVGHGPNITTPELVRDSNGTNITVPCSVSPDAVDVWWISNHRNLPLHGVNFSNNRFSQANSTQNASLSITDTVVYDSSLYWCLAKDADGSIATSERTRVIIYN
ncbi:uncharacterized protein [Argopecten irradians]|uniref:uncharacterized protein n=1 Tax=Argopecten irradians TaxID=31199 RepID=UPI0037121858